MADERPQGMDRRRFLTVLGASGAGTAVLSGCSTGQVEKLIPYLVQSEDQVPSLPTWYASTCTECGAGCGLHVKTREGRAIKLEGNPDHPINAGTLCARGQAGLQGLYNPARLTGPMQRTAAGGFEPIEWDAAIALLAQRVGAAGAGVVAINGQGPGTFSTLLADWAGALGGMVVAWQPFGHEPLRLASRDVFGVDALPTHDVSAARHIVAFGADFLETWMSPVEQQRGFAAAHGYRDGQMARHVFVGPRMSLTGLNADEWMNAAPGTEALVALAMTNVILAERGNLPADAVALRGALAGYTVERAAQESGIEAEAIRRLARDFASARPSLALAGGVGNQHRGAVALAAAVHLLNYVAGNVGVTVRFDTPATAGDGYGALREVVARMDRDEVRVALVHEANPAYALPASAGFAAAFAKVAFKVSTAAVLDETAALCDLVLPALHPLERWDDVEPRAGVRGLMQPVMEPVFAGRHTGDVLLAVARAVGGPLGGLTATSFAQHLQAAWTAGVAGDPAEAWHEAVRTGGRWSAGMGRAVALAPGAAAAAAWSAPDFDGDGEYVFAPYPSPMLYDGRGANRPWLLENPDPVTKLTWQSWIEVHPDVAAALDVRNGEVLEVTSPHGTLEAPVYVYAGIRRDTVAIPLGHGHTEYGGYATGRGVNAVSLLGPSDAAFVPYQSTRVALRKVRKYRQPATTEGTPRQLGRHIVEAMPLPLAARGLTVREAYAAQGGAHHEFNTQREVVALDGWRERQVELQQFGDYPGEHPKWGMAVDLARCTGCSACITACYAENNIPVVGEEEVFRGREMTWLRVERYWEGGEEGEPLAARFAPVMCQHCDNAPCEPVCPVYAAYHTPDGLNGQVYNRCVGTRYCGNNCPYKVRYFNWYAYNKRAFPEPLQLQLNPDVTVRSRGVMEKCTFCVQRIRSAQHLARLEDRPLRDGDVVPACAQACPSGALTFGNVKDPASRVAAAKQDHRGYHMLEEINVRPAVTYLAKVLHQVEG